MAEVGKIFLVQITGMVLHKNGEVKNCWGIEKGSVTGIYMDDFVNKQAWDGEVKIDWGTIFDGDCRG